jgi:hypothetical protein
MGVMAVLMHAAWLSVPTAEDKTIVLFEATVMVPVALTVPQPPVSGML